MKKPNGSWKVLMATGALTGLGLVGVAPALADSNDDDPRFPFGTSGEWSSKGMPVTSFVAYEDSSDNRYFPWLNYSDDSKFISGIDVSDRIRGLLGG